MRSLRYLFVVLMGFSSGLPFSLYFATLSFFMAEAGVSTIIIGFFAWFALVQNLKFLWAPVQERFAVPGLHAAFGRRISWTLVCQLGVLLGLVVIATSDLSGAIWPLAFASFSIAFWSASQDIAIDAWRIETARDDAEQAVFSTLHLWGYRAAMMVAGGGALLIGGFGGYKMAYAAMAALVVGLMATLIVGRPPIGLKGERRPAALFRLPLSTFGQGGLAAMVAVAAVSLAALAVGAVGQTAIAAAPFTISRRDIIAGVGVVVLIPFLITAIAIPRIKTMPTDAPLFTAPTFGPVAEFFRRFGWGALFLLVFISCYRISDLVMSALNKALYADRGYAAETVGAIEPTVGLAAVVLGVAGGGLVSARFGLAVGLTTGAILAVLGNATFVWVALSPVSPLTLAAAVGLDNFAGGFAATAFITYLATLVSRRFTAAQYALFSAFAFLVPQLLAGLSGFVQQAVGYGGFFTYAALLGLPAVVLSPLAARFKPMADTANATSAPTSSFQENAAER